MNRPKNQNCSKKLYNYIALTKPKEKNSIQDPVSQSFPCDGVIA